MYFAATVGDQALVPFKHGRNLLALVWVYQKNYFVMTHEISLWM
jgi:hypothetical protein